VIGCYDCGRAVREVFALPSGNPVRRAAAGMLARATRWVRWLAQHQILCLILFFSFVARLFLANWKSYWYDELLSVAIYGSNHATLVSALKSLAAHSAHPPLYHAILYYWIQIFGTEEVTTGRSQPLHHGRHALPLSAGAQAVPGAASPSRRRFSLLFLHRDLLWPRGPLLRAVPLSGYAIVAAVVALARSCRRSSRLGRLVRRPPRLHRL
jgi:hypothetical protein